MSFWGAAIGSGITLSMISSFGKDIMKGYAKGMGMPGKDIINIFGRKSASLGYIPFVGPFISIASQFTRQGISNWKNVGLSRTMAMETQKFVAQSKRVFSREFEGQLKRISEHSHKEMFRANYINLMKSLKNNPKRYAENMKSHIRKIYADIPGFDTGKINLEGMLTSGERYVQTMEQGMKSLDLFYARLASNTAVVAMPTLSSSIASYAIGKSVWGKTKRRIRGYDPVA